MNRAVFYKLLILAVVGLLLLIVLGSIGGLASERQARQREAVKGVEESLAGAQTLLGPLLLRRCTEIRNLETRDFALTAVPATLQVGGALNHEARYRGLFKVNGYAGRLQLQAGWATASLQPPADSAGSRTQCGPLELMLAATDVRGLRGVELSVNGQRTPVRPGTGHPVYPQGLHASLAAEPAAALTVNLQLDLAGTQQFALVPAAAAVQMNLRSDWPHPSFGGRFLPVERKTDSQGFAARWQVSELASTAAVEVLAGKALAQLDSLGFAMVDPVNPYVMSDRAIKYGVLFILLSFTCVGLVELLVGRRVHPVQYLLVGLAVALFFLLLLSLSEHLAFSQSYAVAASAAVLLLAYYGVHMLGGWARGLGFGAGIAALYGALYLVLSLEQAALLVGALLLFAVLAAVMVLTRRLDWYSLGQGLTR